MRRVILGALVVILTLANSSTGFADEKVCDSHGCVSPAKFATNMYNVLNGKVVGFTVLVGGMFPLQGGWARTATDPPKTEMGERYLTNIASVSKVLTTIAVLQSMSKHKLKLDDKIYPYLYPDWPKGPNIDTITFRELMTHRAGFRENCGGARTTYAKIKEQIGTGVSLTDKATSSYNNCDFAIFREMLPFMEGHPITGTDKARAKQSADFYIAYMNAHVFKPVGLPARQCKAVSTPGSPPVLSYPLPAGSTHGDSWDGWTLSCGGGGWSLSAQDLFWILRDLISGHQLLAKGDLSQLLAPPPNCIAWDCAQGWHCPDPYLCKSGELNSPQKIVLWTYIGIFKCTIPVVVIVNSKLPPGTNGGIVGLVRDAYIAAKVPGTGKGCD